MIGLLLRLARANPGLPVIATLALTSGFATWLLHGPPATRHALETSWQLFLIVLPALGAGVLLAAFLRVLLPRDQVARWMGEGSGLRGLLLAAAAGMAMPGGPMAAFPMVLALGAAGADVGAVIAFILSWAMNGVQRILVWEISVLGPDFAALRLAASLPLPILAGFLARRLPFRPRLEP